MESLIRQQHRPTAAFRLDAGAVIGGGHLSRSGTLATALAGQGWRCLLAATEDTLRWLGPETPFAAIPLACAAEDEPSALRRAWPEGVDLLVVDHYGRDSAFETACRPWARRILVLEDAPGRPHACDMLLDPTPGRGANEYMRCLARADVRLLLGPSFALVGVPFVAARPAALARREAGGAARRALVAVGAGDADNVTARCFDALAAAGAGEFEVDILLGGSAPHLPEMRSRLAATRRPWRLHVAINPSEVAALMERADIAIGAAGVSAWERCCLGLPSVVMAVADNQQPMAAALDRAGAAVVLGSQREVSDSELAQAIMRLIADDDARLRLARNAAEFCDGGGASRVAEEIELELMGGGNNGKWRQASA